MSKPRKKQVNPDFRHRVTCPAPTSQEIESRLLELVTPGTFANLKGVKDKERSLRDRVLTLPMMTAIVLSLVYRQIHYLTDVLRCLEVEGVGRGNISKSASVISTPRELACSVVYQTPGYAYAKPTTTTHYEGWLNISVLWAWSKPLVNDIGAMPQGRLTSWLRL